MRVYTKLPLHMQVPDLSPELETGDPGREANFTFFLAHSPQSVLRAHYGLDFDSFRDQQGALASGSAQNTDITAGSAFK